jgi:ankyrin repeat protein
MLAARGNHALIVRRLVALRVGLDVQNTFGDTALILASQAGAGEVVDVLLGAGAKKTLRNRDGVAAADAAAARGFDAVAARVRSS